MKVALVRGKHLNKYEMQIYEPLVKEHNLVGFGSLFPFHDKLAFPVVKLPSPMDLPNFPYKMPILNRLFIDAQYLFGLENKLKGFDIAHAAETYLHFTQQCLNAKKEGFVKKVVASVFENIPFANEGIWGRKKFKKRSREEVDHFIAISNKSKEVLILEGCKREKITVIGQAIDTKVFYLSKKRLPRLSKRINILFTGRLELYKGIYEVIFAARELLSDKELKNFDLNFTIVGDGSEKNNLLKIEKKLGIDKKIIHKSVTYDKMPAIYQSADIYLAPSRSTRHWQEQFSTVLLEAQASGLPIVTTTSGAIPLNVGDAALLVPEADYLALYKACKTLIKNVKLRKQLSKRARQRAVEVWDIRIAVKKIEDVYLSLF